jgi:uncharacterized membrane protein YphA (DoxX/SURF4 family)
MVQQNLKQKTVERQRENTQTAMTKVTAYLYHLCRLTIAGVFLWSGVTKALHPGDFASIIAAYGLLPDWLIYPAAIVLILAEIVAGVGLLFEKRGALTLITVMMLVFIGILSFGIHLGLDIDCGCFGPNDPEAEAFHDLRGALFRDLLLMLVIGYLYLWRAINHLTPNAWLKPCQCQIFSKEV